MLLGTARWVNYPFERDDWDGKVLRVNGGSQGGCQAIAVAAEDPNHPSPFLFTGRRFDTETGLYHYRARYYNPYIGRFLQTDPIGYEDGMNSYTYCGSNLVGCVDPTGTELTYRVSRRSCPGLGPEFGGIDCYIDLVDPARGHAHAISRP